MDISNTIASYILKEKKDNPIIVAFDGVDTSGKTTLADNVYKILIKKNINVVRVSIDGFHNSKEIRIEKGEFSPEGFFEDSFNLEQIQQLVIDPIKSNGNYLITGIYNYRNESEIKQNQILIENNLIILFDGIFLNRDELYKYWDISIFLDVSFETVLKRAIKRDVEYFGSENEVIKKYKNRYIPGEQIYLSKCNPKFRADIVIDNNDWNNPVIMKGKFF